MSRKVTWLVFDVNNLAWRAFHTTGHLKTEGGTDTGVLYGVLREVRNSIRKWDTTDCVFCFDYGKSKRAQDFPFYKASRRLRKLTDEEEFARRGCEEQIDLLRTTVFERVGLGNVLYKSGYEADDMIAAVCKSLKPEHRAVVVSGDQDLYQCISKKCVVYHPAQQKTVTQESFTEEYGIGPDRWAAVKAIAGCKSDDIPGVGNLVGEKTACVYLAGKSESLPKPKVAHINASKEVIERNMKLVALPYEGTPTPELDPDLRINIREWDTLMATYGFATMTEDSLSRAKETRPGKKHPGLTAKPPRRNRG